MRPPIKARKAQTTQVVSGDGLLVGVDTHADLEPVLQTTHCSGMSSSVTSSSLPTSIRRFVGIILSLNYYRYILHIQTRFLVDETIQTYPLPLVNA